MTAVNTHLSGRPPVWAIVAAYAVPVCILPSALWRAVGAISGRMGEFHWYPVLLSALSLGLGLLTLGLVHSWGERLPRWVPRIGGRRIPIKAAVIPATIGAAMLLIIVGQFVYQELINPFEQINPDLVLLGEKPTDLRPMRVADPQMWREVLWTYSPMAAWPVLLAAVTYAYYRRRMRSLTATPH